MSNTIKNREDKKKFCQEFFYQFHVEKIEHVKSINLLLKKRKKYPFLEILAGINASEFTLQNKDRIREIKYIILECKKYLLEPCLHYTFRYSNNVISDIERIKKTFPQLERIQLNDLPRIKIEYIKKSTLLFKTDIPFSKNQLYFLSRIKLLNIVKQKNCYILLDESKGRGIQEEKISIIKKIKYLRSCQIKNIGIYGGFGPSNLKTYKEITLLYKMNFSIDAETHLKTRNIIDIDKIKAYLSELIKFRDYINRYSH